LSPWFGRGRGVSERRWRSAANRSQLPLRVLCPGGARPGPTDAAAETGAERSPLATSARAGRRDQGVGIAQLPHRQGRGQSLGEMDKGAAGKIIEVHKRKKRPSML